jgi:hypothetical protein
MKGEMTNIEMGLMKRIINIALQNVAIRRYWHYKAIVDWKMETLELVNKVGTHKEFWIKNKNPTEVRKMLLDYIYEAEGEALTNEEYFLYL